LVVVDPAHTSLRQQNQEKRKGTEKRKAETNEMSNYPLSLNDQDFFIKTMYKHSY